MKFLSNPLSLNIFLSLVGFLLGVTVVLVGQAFQKDKREQGQYEYMSSLNDQRVLLKRMYLEIRPMLDQLKQPGVNTTKHWSEDSLRLLARESFLMLLEHERYLYYLSRQGEQDSVFFKKYCIY
jgi:hypothetical protein